MSEIQCSLERTYQVTFREISYRSATPPSSNSQPKHKLPHVLTTCFFTWWQIPMLQKHVAAYLDDLQRLVANRSRQPVLEMNLIPPQLVDDWRMPGQVNHWCLLQLVKIQSLPQLVEHYSSSPRSSPNLEFDGGGGQSFFCCCCLLD